MSPDSSLVLRMTGRTLGMIRRDIQKDKKEIQDKRESIIISGRLRMS